MRRSFPLQAERLVKRFGRVKAVKGVTFRVQPSTITAFLGENGAGKTTTIKLLLGFLRPDSGRVSLCASRVGYVPERPAFFSWLKGGEIIAATALRYRMDRADSGQTTEEFSRRLGFDLGLLDRRVGTYSLGNQKKFAYLQSLLISPELLIVDEPFASLDPRSIMAVRDLMMELRTAGTTVFLSSHLLSELEKVCADFIVIQKGRIVFQENLPKLREHHVLVRFDRSSQDKWGSISLPYPRQVRGRYVEWLIPRDRLGTFDRPRLDKAEVRPLDLEGLYLFLAE
jgi:ABC-2 type transport system ATP-binding protein